MPVSNGFGDFDLTNVDEMTESNSEVRRMQKCIFLFYDIPVQPRQAHDVEISLNQRRFRILGGQGLEYWGSQGGPSSQQAHDVVTTPMRRNDVASTSFRRHVPTGFLINQCQIITFLILKSDNIENSRIDLKGIILQVPSKQIKVRFIIILPFNLVHL